MKTMKYTIAMVSFLSLVISGCSGQEEMIPADRGIEITGISLSMEGRESHTEADTKTCTTKTPSDFSVNTANDPTFKGLSERSSSWKLTFNLYNPSSTTEKYTDGCFTIDAYNGSATLTLSPEKHFPNYKKPEAEAFLYPSAWNLESSTIAINQTDAPEATAGTTLLSQDVLARLKAVIEVAHTPKVVFIHKHAMLNFVIKDVIADDIESVTVKVGNTDYTPYKVTAAATAKGTTAATGTVADQEYMLILPETTADNPVVIIKTHDDNASSITYKQTIKIFTTESGKTTLGSNKCYCFTLQGAELKISPVTVLNWASGESIPGEYIAVTAYPTFKATGHANETFYFYYDNKLLDGSGKAKLQEIKFNENAECTIKPDGRILTHIFKAENTNKEPTEENKLGTPIILGQMIVDVTASIESLNSKP